MFFRSGTRWWIGGLVDWWTGGLVDWWTGGLGHEFWQGLHLGEKNLTGEQENRKTGEIKTVKRVI